MIATLPTRQNRSVSIIDEVVIVDRDGNEIAPLGDALINVSTNWDIDRPGSKGVVEITARGGVLKPNMWVAVFKTIIPELGEIVRHQRGQFKLSQPGLTIENTHLTDTLDNPDIQYATGSDIVDDLAAVVLRESFYSPPGGNPTSDIRTLIRLGTSGYMGPNLLPNGGFEDGLSGWWSDWYGNGANSSNTSVHDLDAGAGSFVQAEGTKYMAMNFKSDAPATAYRAIYRSIPLPTNAEFIYVIARVRRQHPDIWAQTFIAFDDAAGETIDSRWLSARIDTQNQWCSIFNVARVPDGTATISIGLFSQSDSAGGSGHWIQWDDVRVGVCTAIPIPESRINLPPSTIAATTRIQTTVGKSVGYDAINGDRLAAIGNHALYTEMSGRLTSSPLRDIATATPKRQYTAGDIRITSPREIKPGNAVIYNHFPAIKESFTEGVEPMYEESWNRNPDDPYSIVNTGQALSAPPIMVPDAVDEDALRAVADAARDNQSTREEMSFNILFDAGLSIYDVIIIDGVRWAIKSISDDGPEMTIIVRRAIGG